MNEVEQARAALAAAEAKARAPLTELMASPEFVAVLARVEALPAALDVDTVVGPYVKNLRAGTVRLRDRLAQHAQLGR